MPTRDLDVDQVYWSRVYRDIALMLDLDPEEDRKATNRADEIFMSRGDELPKLIGDLSARIAGNPVVIFGCGPSLDQHVDELRSTLLRGTAALIAADGATSALLESGIVPDVIVTDLDGNVPDIISASRRGALTILHFHGDNQESASRHLPALENVIPVTQNEPTEFVRNFGGFTDGDKCLFLAVAFGAAMAILVGMDFGDTVGPRSSPGVNTDSPNKIRKLEIGKGLCQELIRRSGIDVYTLSPRLLEGAHNISPEDVRKMLDGGHGNA